MKNLASLTVLMRFNGDFKSVLLFRPPCTVYIIRITGNRNKDYIKVEFAKKVPASPTTSIAQGGPKCNPPPSYH